MIQRWFQAVATHPGGVSHGVHSDMARAAIATDTVDAVVAPSERQTADERMGIYAHAYWARLVECLREEFPTMRTAIGDDAFDDLAVDYLQVYPSTSYTLGKLGAAFSAHLLATRPDDDWSLAVVELATLERNISEVFDLPGGETLGFLDAASLAAIAPADRETLRLQLLSTVRLLHFEFDVNTWFTQLRAGDADAVPQKSPTYVALSRRDYVVRRHTLSRIEWQLLTHLAAGETLGNALATTGERNPAALDELTNSVARRFREWAAAGLFASV
jgi:hypothetical protein